MSESEQVNSSHAAPAVTWPRVSFNSPSLDGLVVVLVQHWRWIVCAGLVFAVASLIALPFLTPAYEIKASLLCKLGREQLPPSVAGGTPVSTPFKRPEDVASEIEIIKSQVLVEQLVKAFGTDYFTKRKEPQTLWEHVKYYARTAVRAIKDAFTEVQIWLGLEKRLTPFEKVVSDLQGSITAEAVKRADVIDVTLLFADQVAGIEVMTKLLDLYAAEHIRVFQTPGATRFLGERVAELKTELARLEEEKRRFGSKGAVWDFDEQHKLLLQQAQDVQTTLSKIRQDRSKTASEIEQASTMLKAGTPETRLARVEQANPVVQALEERIMDRRAALEKLRQTFGDDSRRIKDAEAEITKLQQMVANSKKTVTTSETYEVSSGYRETERTLMEKRNRLAGLVAQEQQLTQELKNIEANLAKLDAMGEQARNLQREITLTDQTYQLYSRRLEEARISDALDAAAISNVSVIAQPTASIRPVRPKSKLLFLASLAAGLFGMAGFLLLRDAMRPVVHSRDKAMAVLGAPVLVRLPEVRS